MPRPPAFPLTHVLSALPLFRFHSDPFLGKTSESTPQLVCSHDQGPRQLPTWAGWEGETGIRQMWGRFLQIHPGREQTLGVGETGARAPASLVAQTGRTAGSDSQKPVAPSWQDGPLPAGPTLPSEFLPQGEEVGWGWSESLKPGCGSPGVTLLGERWREDARGGAERAVITTVISLNTE